MNADEFLRRTVAGERAFDDAELSGFVLVAVSLPGSRGAAHGFPSSTCTAPILPAPTCAPPA